MKILYNGNIKLVGNKILKEVGFKIIFIFPIYIFSQLLTELKFFFTRYFLVLFLPRKFKKIIIALRHDGFYLYPNFYKDYEIKSINYYLKNKIDEKKFVINKILGTKKISNLESDKYLHHFSNDIFLFFLNFFFSLSLNKPAIKYLVTNKIHSCKDQKIFASHLHFDAYKNELKVLIPLKNILIKNGPTFFLKKSGRFHFKYFRQYFVSWLQVHKFIKENKENNIPFEKFNNENVNYLCAKKNDLIIFDSRFFHAAQRINAGSREILWFYF